MKKITLLLLLSLSAAGLQAQNFYTLTASQQTYADLENTTSINNNQVWAIDLFDPIAIPFNFSVAGETVDRFLFDDDYFVFLTPGTDYDTADEGMFFFDNSPALVQDRTFSTGTSSSPVSYKVEGETGNRILKVEIKNAGLENSQELGFSEDHFYINYQIWVYEAGNIIELRYGNHNITDKSVVTDDDGILLVGIVDDSAKAYYVSGQSTNPTYGEYTELTLPDDLTMDAFPANGTVYRWTPAALVNLEDFTAASVKLYPNPASSVLNLKSDNLAASEYAIYNVTGALVAQSKIDNANDIQINVEGLEEGLYLVKINNQYLKFIKRK